MSDSQEFVEKLRSMKPAGRESWDGERWWTMREMIEDSFSRVPAARF